VRNFYEEVFWDDLNQWLATNEKRVRFRFPDPSGNARKPAVPDVLIPLEQAASMMAWEQLPATEANRVWAVETYSRKWPDRPAPILDGVVCDEAYLAVLRSDAAKEIQHAIDVLVSQDLLPLFSPALFVPTKDRHGALVSTGAVIELMASGAHLVQPKFAVEVPPKPIQRSQAQDVAILAKLRDLGFDPQAVPAPEEGKTHQIKRRVQAELGYSPAVMNKAWTRLRADGRVKDA